MLFQIVIKQDIQILAKASGFQNYVILDSNKTKGALFVARKKFQNYVILDSNKTHIII